MSVGINNPPGFTLDQQELNLYNIDETKPSENGINNIDLFFSCGFYKTLEKPNILLVNQQIKKLKIFVTKNDKVKDPNVITSVIIFASATLLLTISKAIVDDIALCSVSTLMQPTLCKGL